MKVLLVSHADLQGGAARAAYRLHRSLLTAGVRTQLLVQSKASGDDTVLSTRNRASSWMRLLRPTLDALPLQRYPQKTQTFFSPAWLPFGGVLQRVREFGPDLVHLHWICAGMMRIEDISRIHVPVIWTLHDMWPFTGGCHYHEGCDGFRHTCGRCKVLGSATTSDLSASIWRRKRKMLGSLRSLTAVGLSRWLAETAAESALFKNIRVVHLPNPIDTQIFAPFAKNHARNLFNLPLDKRLILFGATNAAIDSIKGFEMLGAALGAFDASTTELLVFGSPPRNPDRRGIYNTRYLGQLHDDVALRALYNAVDVTVVPSLQENLSNIILESISCGTPVVGFDIGGNADMIDHRQNGYLATPSDIYDLASGIKWVLANNGSGRVSAKARRKAVDCFASALVAKQYIRLYQESVSQHRPR